MDTLSVFLVYFSAAAVTPRLQRAETALQLSRKEPLFAIHGIQTGAVGTERSVVTRCVGVSHLYILYSVGDRTEQ
jgi:hypothetical protein